MSQRKSVKEASKSKSRSSSSHRSSERDRRVASNRMSNSNSLTRTRIVPTSRVGEKKTCDTFVQNHVIDNTGAFYLLNGIQEGASFYNRVGRRIQMKSLRFIANYDITGTGTGAGTGNQEYHRIMLIYDRQPNGNFPAPADILLTYNDAGATETTTFSHLNMNNAERFQILADIRNYIPDNASTGTTNYAQSINDPKKSEFNIDRYIQLRGAETHYKSSTNPAAIGDISSGALYLFFVGNQDTAVSQYTLYFSSRIRYSDV